jgi:hypothetical protein
MLVRPLKSKELLIWGLYMGMEWLILMSLQILNILSLIQLEDDLEKVKGKKQMTKLNDITK